MVVLTKLCGAVALGVFGVSAQTHDPTVTDGLDTIDDDHELDANRYDDSDDEKDFDMHDHDMDDEHPMMDEESESPFPTDAMSKEQLKSFMEMLDEDQNGKVSLEELKKYAHEQRERQAHRDAGEELKELDKDGDAKISVKELLDVLEGEEMAQQRRMEEMRFHAADTDKDGFLTHEEFVGIFNPTGDLVKVEFDGMDTDKDGAISKQEYQEGFGYGSDFEDDSEFTRLDLNQDGSLDVVEFGELYHGHGAFADLFASIDDDQDGDLSHEEADKHFEKLSDHSGLMSLIDQHHDEF